MWLEEFNAADRDAAIAVLRPCLDITRWRDELADARPYGSVDELVAWAEAAASPFTAEEVGGRARAPPAHRRATRGRGRRGGDVARRAGRRRPGDAEIAAALAAGNRAYEERFGRVFLIRAAGRSSREILAALTERLGHTPAEEEPVVADQLREIAVLRLKGLLA